MAVASRSTRSDRKTCAPQQWKTDARRRRKRRARQRRRARAPPHVDASLPRTLPRLPPRGEFRRLRARSVSKFAARASFRLSRFFRMDYIRSMVRGGSQQAEGDEGGGLLPVRELDAIERAHPEGMTSAQVVEVFRARGVKLLRGDLPQVRAARPAAAQPVRVGRKGKHQGSMRALPVDGGAPGQRRQADDGRGATRSKRSSARSCASRTRSRRSRRELQRAVRRLRARG